MSVLISSKNGFENALAKEISAFYGAPQAQGPGWILAQWNQPLSKIPCFACHIFEDPIKISGSSVNDLTEKLLTPLLTHLKDKRINEPWPRLFLSAENEELSRRMKTVEKNWLEKMTKKMSRVMKLSQDNIPINETLTDGFFVYFTDFNEAFVSFKALSAGQQRMQMDDLAPSRSYLKIEEAFHILGLRPSENESVIDLGAAPGGWSYSALKCGAHVVAIDNGPLKGVVKDHPNISHLMGNALDFQYTNKKPVDWLFCDMLDKPDLVLDLLHKWLIKKWCRKFIVNLKIGRTDPIVILKKIDHRLASYCKLLKVRQLYHDREEITLMGEAIA